MIPHSEQEGASADMNVFNRTYEWYTSGPRQRLQPNGAIVVVMTRWHNKDLTGQVVDASIKAWRCRPMGSYRTSCNHAFWKPTMWAEFWKMEELQALKAELPNSKWMAQYQQDPTSEEGAIS